MTKRPCQRPLRPLTQPFANPQIKLPRSALSTQTLQRLHNYADHITAFFQRSALEASPTMGSSPHTGNQSYTSSSLQRCPVDSRRPFRVALSLALNPQSGAPPRRCPTGPTAPFSGRREPRLEPPECQLLACDEGAPTHPRHTPSLRARAPLPHPAPPSMNAGSTLKSPAGQAFPDPNPARRVDAPERASAFTVLVYSALSARRAQRPLRTPFRRQPRMRLCRSGLKRAGEELPRPHSSICRC